MGRSNCATASALEIVGDRWSLIILRDIIFIGRREYNDLIKLNEGISTNILASRLVWLTDSGILIKHLTEKTVNYTIMKLQKKEH